MQAARPTYHMRIKELDFFQSAERLWFAQHHPADLRELRRKHQRDRVELHRKNRAIRLHAKAEKALHNKSKIEPDFWNDFPNHDGRRDTMEAVLVSLGQPKEQAMEIMVTYATWLLTANKMHENGRPKNRWALMTGFVVEALLIEEHPSLLE